jgi:hypothetical protein
MVNFAASVTLLLAAASATVAVPNTLEKRKVTCRDDRPNSELANVRLLNHISRLSSKRN